MDALSKRLSVVESETMRRGYRDPTGIDAHFKAACYVWVAAVLENAVGRYATDLRTEILARGTADDVLKCTVSQWLLATEWSLAAKPGRLGWAKRSGLAAGELPTANMGQWSERQSFADGHTVEAKLLDAIWVVLELPDSPFTSPIQRGALNNIHGLRNRVAHGEETPEEIGRKVTFEDVSRAIGHTQDILVNWLLCTEQWLSSGGWK